MGFAVFAHVKTDMGGNQLQVGSVNIVEPVLIIGFADPKNAEICKKCEYSFDGQGWLYYFTESESPRAFYRYQDQTYVYYE